MRYVLSILFIVFSSSTGYSQTVVASGTAPFGQYQFSSTSAEGYMRGLAAMQKAHGEFLRDLGEYENLHQSAVDRYLENNSKRIQYYYNSKKFYHEYLKEKYAHRPTPSVIVRNNNAGFVVDGQRFSTVNEWMQSNDFRLTQDLRRMDDIIDDMKSYNENTQKISNQNTLRQYNKNRTMFGVNHLNKEYRESVKRIMGWETFPHVVTH